MRVEEALKAISGEEFINARKLARKLNITTREAGRILKKLNDLGYLKIYRKRKGRFTIYRPANPTFHKFVET
ncbi:MAG: HTH domain-containing protein [Sulfolobales archaeon]